MSKRTLLAIVLIYTKDRLVRIAHRKVRMMIRCQVTSDIIRHLNLTNLMCRHDDSHRVNNMGIWPSGILEKWLKSQIY